MLKTIQVTEMDIKAGRPGHGLACPIALAIKRVVKAETKVHVGTKEFTVGIGKLPLDDTGKFPDRATEFIRAFDTPRPWYKRIFYNPVKPFVFQIDIPDEFLAETHNPLS